MTRSSIRAIRMALRWAILSLTPFVLAGCAAQQGHRALALPPVGGLWTLALFMVEEAENTNGPPAWSIQTRLEDGLVFGLGIRRAQDRSERDLYLAMREARDSIAEWIDEHEIPPPRLLPVVPFDVSGIFIEKIAYDWDAERWYVLAHMDLQKEASRVAAKIAVLNDRLSQADQQVVNTGLEFDDRLRSALAILYDLERRGQYRAQYRVLAGEELQGSLELDVATLQDHADDLLSEHGVRVLVDGNSTDALYVDLEASVFNAIGEVHIGRNLFGEGMISISMNEKQWQRDRSVYLELAGEIQMIIEGGDARSYTVPVRVVEIGVDVESARLRAIRSVSQEVNRIVRETLIQIAGVQQEGS